MSNPKTTHILEFYPEVEDDVPMQTERGLVLRKQRRPSQAVLYRASDGMCIAARQATVVSCGEDKDKAIIRTFRDETFATMFLRKFADDDWRRTNGGDRDGEYFVAHIEEIDCTEKVQKAQLARPSLADIGVINKTKV